MQQRQKDRCVRGGRRNGGRQKQIKALNFNFFKKNKQPLLLFKKKKN